MRRLSLTLLVVLLTGGCALIPEPTVRLLTDRAELAAYMEAYNASQADRKVEIVYDPDPAAALRRGAPECDVVIAAGIAAPDASQYVAGLERLFKEEALDAALFYSPLLASGVVEEVQYLLPFSFNMPIMVFRSQSVVVDPERRYLSPTAIRGAADGFSVEQDGLYRKLGFSPLWDPLFIYYDALLRGLVFDLRGGAVVWDEDLLESMLEEYRQWLEQLVPEKVDEFNRRYFQVPEYQLLSDERILFYLSTVGEFLSIPEEKRGELDFRWLGDERGIPVGGDVLWAAIPRSTGNRAGARALLEWIFRAETQARMMEINHYKRLTGVYGVAGGLSGLISVNERDLPQPQKYPLFVGRVPSEEELLVPRLTSARWLGIRDQVIVPWLAQAALPGGQATPLEERLHESGLLATN
jgi:ABC-type glycerol-3-phosphate transport system substrate-binding protein